MLVGFIFLILVNCFLCGMSLTRKQYQIKTDNSISSTLVFMGLGSVVTCLVGSVYGLIDKELFNIFKFQKEIFFLALLLSITITITTILCIIGTAYGNISILIMFSTLGTLVLSSLYGLIFDKENNVLSLTIIIGMIISLVILVLTLFDKDNNKEKDIKTKKEKLIYKIFCIVVFFTNGIALVVYRIITQYFSSYGDMNFIILYSFLAVLVCLILLMLISMLKKNKESSIKVYINKNNLFYISLYAFLFTGSEILSIKSTKMIPIIIQAPLSFAIEIIILTIADSVIYHTKISKKEFVQIILAIVVSILFAL